MVTTNAEYFLRLLLLNVQVATPALCETFVSFVGISTKKSVDDFLKVFENGFKSLEKKRIIKKAEFTKLFPSIGKTLVREWDISLLCSVLSHCCTLNGKLYELRDMLYQESQRNVNNFVQTHRTAINSMKGAEIDDDEYETVYPADYSDSEYEKWNTHLIMQILIKLCPAKKTSVMNILRDIFIQEVGLKCSKLDINEFLKFYKSKLLDIKNKGYLSKAQFDTLFPVNGSDINTWDDHTLEVVVLNTTSTLSKKSIGYLRKIRTIRSDFLAHRGDAEVEFTEFSEKRHELTKAVTKILEEEKLPILEIKEKINDIVDGPLEIRPAIDCLKAYYAKESSQNDMILVALNSIESNVLGAVDAVGQKVDVGFGSMDSKFEEVLKEVRDLKGKITDSAYTEEAEIRCVDMIFVIKSITVERKEKAEHIMMNALKQAQQNTTAQIQAAFDAIRKIITEDGKIIIEVKQGSVILVIKCFSLKALHRLLEYVGSELMKSQLAEAVTALNDSLGGTSDITVAMSYASLVNVCEDIVRYLIYYVDHTSHLKVTIKRPSKEELQYIVREFKVGEGVAQLRTLSSKLSDYLGENITIDTVTPEVCSSSELQLKETMSGKLSKADRAQLEKWIKAGHKDFQLLYSFTRDGANSETFHNKCNNQGATVTVIYNTNGSVYGGFTEQSWTSSDEFYQDVRAFLFRLQLDQKDMYEKFPAKANGKNAIHDDGDYGPTFGSGYDLPAFTNTLTADGAIFTLNCETDFGNSYEMNGVTSKDITNDIKTVTELEVYKVMDAELVKSWRPTPEWNLEYMEGLKREVENFTLPQALKVKQAKVLILGPVGAGKSSFFNTIASVFRGHVTSQACSGSAEQSITAKFRMYQVRSKTTGQPLNFRLCDIRGLEESQGIDTQELTYILDGNVTDGYQFNPSTPICSETPGFKTAGTLKDKVHCVCFVIDGSTANILPEKMLEKIKSLQMKIHQKGIPQVVLLTKVDNVCPFVADDLSTVFQSAAIGDLVDQVSQILGVPRGHVLPMKNYEKEIDLADNVNLLALLSLRQILRASEDYMYNHLDMMEESAQKADTLE